MAAAKRFDDDLLIVDSTLIVTFNRIRVGNLVMSVHGKIYPLPVTGPHGPRMGCWYTNNQFVCQCTSSVSKLFSGKPSPYILGHHVYRGERL